MPRGKMRIAGAVGSPFPSNELCKIRARVIDAMVERRSADLPPLSDNERDEAWKKLDSAVASYRGFMRSSPPPTAGEAKKALTSISKAIEELEHRLADASIHVRNWVHKEMRRNGGDLISLKKQLKSAEGVGIINPGSGSPDPYLGDLVDSLIDVWHDITGRLPGRVSDAYKGADGGPFYEWINEVLACCSVRGHKPVAADQFLRDKIRSAKRTHLTPNSYGR